MEISPSKNPYQKQRKQRSQIIRRIDRKRSTEIFLKRSQGFLIQSELKRDLRKIPRNNQKAQTLGPSTLSQPRPILRKNKSEKLSSFCFQRSQCNAENRFNNSLNQNALEQQTLLIERAQNGKKKLNLRPELEELRNYLSVQNVDVLIRRQKMIQMLILCLMRRCQGKLYEALDIVIEASSHLDRSDSEIVLKCLCLRLIGKIFQETTSPSHKTKQKFSAESLSKRAVRRHSSFMIQTLASQRVFLNRFAQKFNRSRQIREANYQSLLRQQRTKTPSRESDPNGVVLYKVSQKVAIGLHPPSQLFPERSEAANYAIVTHRRSKEDGGTFTYSFPRALEGCMKKQDFFQMIGAANGILYRESMCYTDKQVFAELFPSVLLALTLIAVVLIICQSESSQTPLIAAVTLLAPVLLWAAGRSFLIAEENYRESQVVYEEIVKELKKWNAKYSQESVKLNLSRCCCNIVIFCICDEENSTEPLTSNQTDSIREFSCCSNTQKIDSGNRNLGVVKVDNNPQRRLLFELKNGCQDFESIREKDVFEIREQNVTRSLNLETDSEDERGIKNNDEERNGISKLTENDICYLDSDFESQSEDEVIDELNKG